VAAFSSPPRPSKISAISCAECGARALEEQVLDEVGDTPARASVSSREPVPIQKPNETERTVGMCSVDTRSPSERRECHTAACDPILVAPAFCSSG
jgi:hypothetical protein